MRVVQGWCYESSIKSACANAWSDWKISLASTSTPKDSASFAKVLTSKVICVRVLSSSRRSVSFVVLELPNNEKVDLWPFLNRRIDSSAFFILVMWYMYLWQALSKTSVAHDCIKSSFNRLPGVTSLAAPKNLCTGRKIDGTK